MKEQMIIADSNTSKIQCHSKEFTYITELMAKDEPMKPIAHMHYWEYENGGDHMAKVHNCGRCGRGVCTVDKFCPHCGQRINWDGVKKKVIPIEKAIADFEGGDA